MAEHGERKPSGKQTMLMMVMALVNAVTVQASRKLVVPALIVFGDSTVDVGMNNNITTVVKSNFLPYGRDFVTRQATGRFCNGQVPSDFVATELGLQFPLPYLNPDAQGQNIVRGISFASSASGYNDNTAKFFNTISLGKQLEYFESYKKDLARVVGGTRASYILSEALYVLSTGSNDYANNYFFNVRLRSKFQKPEYLIFLLHQASTYIESIYRAGARKLAVVNVPPLGCLPAQRALLGRLDFADCVESANAAASSFNQGLESVVESLKTKYADFRIVYLDCYSPMLDMYHNPSKYGIEEVKRGCCATGRVETAILCNPLDAALSCEEPSKYLFWDSYHPTETVYKRLTDMFIKIILDANIF